ncbi:MAG: hypothetical protein ACRDX9_14780, partial [Acidimicrobiia bacterium]
GARQARKLIETAGLGEATLGEEGVVTFVHGSADTTTGDVLTSLEPVVAEIAHLREVERPLRDILADMYRESHQS